MKSFSSNSIHSLAFTLNSYERSEKILNSNDHHKNDESNELDETELEDKNQITITSVSSISSFKNLKYTKSKKHNENLLSKKAASSSSTGDIKACQNKFKMFDKGRKKSKPTQTSTAKNSSKVSARRSCSSRTVTINQTNIYKDIIKTGTTNQTNRNMSRCGSGSGDISGYVAVSTAKNLNKSMKAMKTLLILLMGFYICWLPLIVYFLTFATKKYNNLTIYILMFVACCNAVIDPLVYAFRNREFCKALLLNFSFKKN